MQALGRGISRTKLKKSSNFRKCIGIKSNKISLVYERTEVLAEVVLYIVTMMLFFNSYKHRAIVHRTC